MTRRPALALAALAAAALAACSGGVAALPPRFDGPTGMAVFRGFTSRRPGELHRYLAVANARGDDLRYVDVEDDQLVMSPTVVFPLSVPTAVPRPARVVATSLGAEAEPGADLLVVVGSGSLRLEVVSTWAGSERIASTVDLGAVAGPGAALLSLAAVPGAPGRARVYAGLSGARLAVVDFERGADGAVAQLGPARLLGLAFGAFPFDPLDIAATPQGHGPAGVDRLFVATNDALAAGVFGVALVDVAPNAATGEPEVAATSRPLDALAPTRLVAAAVVSERSTSQPDDFSAPPALRAYAFLDTSQCGVGFPIGCGLATLLPEPDPARGNALAPDPVEPELPRTPIPIPFVVGAMAAVQQADPASLTRIGLNSSGDTRTTGLVGLAGPDAVYFVDLGRYSLANTVSYVAASSRTQAAGAELLRFPDQPWLEVADLETGELVLPTLRNAAIGITPGFTTDDTWLLSWQGLLPGYRALPAVLGRDAGGPWLAFQSDSGLTPEPDITWFVNGRLDLPEKGVHVGDLAEVFEVVQVGQDPICDASEGNPTPGGISTAITALLPPSADRPGGAARLADLGCLDPLVPAGGLVQVVAQLRAPGLLLVGTAFGYAGRPQIDVPYEIRWRPEGTVTDPEELAIVQKARRRQYPPSKPCAGDPIFTGIPCNPVDPLAPGPLLAIRVKRVEPDPLPPNSPLPLPAGTGVQFQTRSGVSTMSRRPPSVSSRPAGIVGVYRAPGDPSDADRIPAERTDFYTTFEDGQVLHVPQGRPPNEVVSIR